MINFCILNDADIEIVNFLTDLILICTKFVAIFEMILLLFLTVGFCEKKKKKKKRKEKKY